MLISDKLDFEKEDKDLIDFCDTAKRLIDIYENTYLSDDMKYSLIFCHQGSQKLFQSRYATTHMYFTRTRLKALDTKTFIEVLCELVQTLEGEYNDAKLTQSAPPLQPYSYRGK